MPWRFLLLVLTDQITKSVFAGRDFFLPGIRLHPMRNYGLPFAIDLGGGWNTVILALVYAVVGWLVLRTPSTTRALVWGKAMFLAGATSNLADRLIFGYVRDFLDLGLGFVFNLADVLIVTGLLAIVFSRTQGKSGDKPPLTGNS